MAEEPAEEELTNGEPLSGATGRILRAELARVGIDMYQCRITNVWMHPKIEGRSKAARAIIRPELDWHSAKMIAWIRNCRYVLLLGSDATQVFFQEAAQNISGLVLKSPLLPKTLCVAAPNPADLFYSPLGEFRLALDKFGALVKKGK